jgi:hypothetical protein
MAFLSRNFDFFEFFLINPQKALMEDIWSSDGGINKGQNVEY